MGLDTTRAAPLWNDWGKDQDQDQDQDEMEPTAADEQVLDADLEQTPVGPDQDEQVDPNRGAGVTFTRQQVTDRLPDGVYRSISREDADMPTIPSSSGPRVSGGTRETLAPAWLQYLNPKMGLRPYIMGCVRQIDDQAATTYEAMLRWMDVNGYPAAEAKYLPDGVLDRLANQFRCSERTIKRRIVRAQVIMAGHSYRFS